MCLFVIIIDGQLSLDISHIIRIRQNKMFAMHEVECLSEMFTSGLEKKLKRDLTNVFFVISAFCRLKTIFHAIRYYNR